MLNVILLSDINDIPDKLNPKLLYLLCVSFSDELGACVVGLDYSPALSPRLWITKLQKQIITSKNSHLPLWLCGYSFVTYVNISIAIDEGVGHIPQYNWLGNNCNNIFCFYPMCVKTASVTSCYNYCLNVWEEVKEIGASCRLYKEKEKGAGGNIKHMWMLQALQHQSF